MLRKKNILHPVKPQDRVFMQVKKIVVLENENIILIPARVMSRLIKEETKISVAVEAYFQNISSLNENENENSVSLIKNDEDSISLLNKVDTMLDEFENSTSLCTTKVNKNYNPNLTISSPESSPETIEKPVKKPYLVIESSYN